MKRIISGVLIFAAAAALAVWVPQVKPTGGVLPVVHAQDEGNSCSLASLNGSYAVSRQGTLLTSVLGLPAPAPWGEVARANFNGAGTLSGTANVNIGGVALSATFTGTYTVNSDCTGSITVHPNVPVTITEAIVVIGGGHQYTGTDTEPFAVVQTRGERIGN